MIKERVWFPWSNQYGYVDVNRKTKKGLGLAEKVGRVYYCTLPSTEKELLPHAFDLHGFATRIY